MLSTRLLFGALVAALAMEMSLTAEETSQPSMANPSGASNPNTEKTLASSQAVIHVGPSSFSTDANQFYRIGGQRFHFTAKRVNGSFTWSAVKKLASTTSTLLKTQKYDDLWYFHTLPTSGDDYLLLMWRNLDQGTFEWAAVKNSPQQWTVISSKSTTAVSHPGNGTQVKLRWIVTSANKIIDIDIFNPPNTNGWTSNDIWYGFGF